MIINARKDITEKGIVKKMNKIPRKDITEHIRAELKEMMIMGASEMLSLHSFIQYLISEEKDKKFLTPRNSIIAKNKEILEKNHNCKIIILSEEQDKKIKKIRIGDDKENDRHNNN
jgi:hypothetical protein